ncbi:E3 ubiquitin-protein [Vigna angularis]|uniref:RING-type E3 ubiquitin transferase n=2 Tax=Phaseolus angularis TaxID=3914 RepID=A0A8T0L3E6_PHAAN|nr:E3 ubiquitin-protein ligase RHF2A isoform X1 [Vigna angularis]XP_017419466.2 E3 ubiquitin-protein ligase RHF2A isoform X1 [Vigna angularis]XP_017419467.2 E3 ubiquitin-protein ligase RHF2A isoform X1 [Vigna angularis]XP_052729163.1 E3 ubiquitin-protein ligase RHF2A isoform X1 [Vigna angularis]BAT86397.1 hypothetical protein VIGAN_04404200 [Vigna angularis var. angularis]KAG2406667.1 E3 ubiquitin-protein [Vigna angularis]
MEGNKESKMISAAAFVEGGIQDSCDDACSICLEEFSASDPSTFTNCKHEFHLHCILEWCQRSSQCPMCWQSISLKDLTSQELFEAVEQERKLRVATSRNATIFHHPAFNDFELQHLRMNVNDIELEEQIIQHLAVAAAMRRADQLGRRAGRQANSSPRGHPHSLVLSNMAPAEEENDQTIIPNTSASTPIKSERIGALQQMLRVRTQSSSSASGSRIYSNDRGSTTPSSSVNGDKAEFQSHSDSLRSRFNAVSARYKESISKGARGWKERLFCRSCSMSELGSETWRREMNSDISSVSRLKESLESSENRKAAGTSLSIHMEDCSIGEVSNHNDVEVSGETSSHDDNTPPACSAASHLN